jgi:hypothetical protein
MEVMMEVGRHGSDDGGRSAIVDRAFDALVIDYNL